MDIILIPMNPIEIKNAAATYSFIPVEWCNPEEASLQ